jgi:hypothetical protein
VPASERRQNAGTSFGRSGASRWSRSATGGGRARVAFLGRGSHEPPRFALSTYDALITKYATFIVAGAVGALLMLIVNCPVPAEAFFTEAPDPCSVASTEVGRRHSGEGDGDLLLAGGDHRDVYEWRGAALVPEVELGRQFGMRLSVRTAPGRRRM